MTGPHHSIIPPLHVDRTGRGGVHADLQRRYVILGPRLLGELQHPYEHRRHNLRDADLVLAHEAQVVLRIEALHDDDRAARHLNAHAETQRCRVVQRRGREVSGVFAEAEQPGAQAADAGPRLLERSESGGGDDALRAAGGARAVEHVGAGDPVRQRLRRRLLDRGLVAVVAVDGAVDHEPQLDVGHLDTELGGLIGLVGRGDEDLRSAIVDDVRHLLGGEATAHRRVDQAGVVGAPANGQESRMVLHAEGDVVAHLESPIAKDVREPVRLRVEFAIRDAFARGRHDDGGVIGTAGGVGAGYIGSSWDLDSWILAAPKSPATPLQRSRTLVSISSRIGRTAAPPPARRDRVDLNVEVDVDSQPPARCMR